MNQGFIKVAAGTPQVTVADCKANTRAILEVIREMETQHAKLMVLLAASLCERAHLHVWDEPLNYIDVISRIQIEELLLRFRPTIVFVEHDKAFCEHVATRIVSMQKA